MSSANSARPKPNGIPQISASRLDFENDSYSRSIRSLTAQTAGYSVCVRIWSTRSAKAMIDAHQADGAEAGQAGGLLAEDRGGLDASRARWRWPPAAARRSGSSSRSARAVEVQPQAVGRGEHAAHGHRRGARHEADHQRPVVEPGGGQRDGDREARPAARSASSDRSRAKRIWRCSTQAGASKAVANTPERHHADGHDDLRLAVDQREHRRQHRDQQAEQPASRGCSA